MHLQRHRYDSGAGEAWAPDTLLSIRRRCRQNLKPATRTATNAGMSDIEEAVRAILKACAELSAAQAALDRTPDTTTAPRDHAVTKVIEAFNRFAAGARRQRSRLRSRSLSAHNPAKQADDAEAMTLASEQMWEDKPPHYPVTELPMPR